MPKFTGQITYVTEIKFNPGDCSFATSTVTLNFVDGILVSVS